MYEIKSELSNIKNSLKSIDLELDECAKSDDKIISETEILSSIDIINNMIRDL